MCSRASGLEDDIHRSPQGSLQHRGDELEEEHNVFLGFQFAKLLRNFCGTKRKIFLSLCINFARKNDNLRNHLQKSFRAKLPYSTFAKLKFCAIPQFRKNQTVGVGVCFLEFNSGKVLFWNVFLLVTFTIDQ